MSNGKVPQKNTFRDEIKKETVSEQEMLERDQKITYLRLKNQAKAMEADYLHMQRMIEKYKAFGNKIFRLPNSEGRTAVLDENKKHIETLEKQLEASRLNRAQHVILSILEEKFGLQVEADKEAVQVDSEPVELKDD